MEKAELLKLIGEGVVRYSRFERRPEKFLFYQDLVVVMGDETVVPRKVAFGVQACEQRCRGFL